MPDCPTNVLDSVTGRLTSVLSRLVSAVTTVFGLLLFFLISLVPSKENVWVFGSRGGEAFEGNSRHLLEYINVNTSDIRAVWLTKDKNLADKLRGSGYEAYHVSHPKGLYLAIRSGVYLYTHGLKDVLWWSSGNSIKVQLWHCIPFKTMGRDYKSSLVRRVNYSFRVIFGLNYDYRISTTSKLPMDVNSPTYDTEDDRGLVTGLPRNDTILCDSLETSQECPRVFREIRDRSEFTILYAPTWRIMNGEQNGQPLDGITNCFDEIDDLLGTLDGHIYFQQHPMDESMIETEQYERITSVNKEIDIYPVMDQFDLLITDYSSIFYDYLLTEKPIVFYAHDLSQFTTDRELYVDYESFVPGPIATDCIELTAILRCYSERSDDPYERNRETIRNQIFDHYDGRSSERVIRKIRNIAASEPV